MKRGREGDEIAVKRDSKSKRPRKAKTRAISAAVRDITPQKTAPRVARKLTSRFHALLQREAVLLAAKRDGQDIKDALRAVHGKLEEMGGRKAYQDASISATSKFRTSRWVLGVMRDFGVGGDVPSVLEVGAVNRHLLDARGYRVTAIDLAARERGVVECDFFKLGDMVRRKGRAVFPNWPESGTFDAVVCVLVLNSVPDPRDRGRMLREMVEYMSDVGVLFLVLPTRCITSSPFMSPSSFAAILASLDLVPIHARETPRLLLWALKKRTSPNPIPIVTTSSLSGFKDLPKEATKPLPPWPTTAEAITFTTSRMTYPPTLQNPRAIASIRTWDDAIKIAKEPPQENESAAPLFAISM